MKPRLPTRTATLCLALLLAACATTAPPSPQGAALATTPAHDNLNATLWMQNSAEYEALLRGTYAQARRQLEVALATPSWDALVPSERPIGSGFESLPPAVIVDIDETMLDNSPFQARGIRDRQDYNLERWIAWSNERRARALPGALEFARAAADRGVTVWFISNRKHEGEVDSTADNLLALGFPLLDDRSNLLLKGDPRAPASEKAPRRAYVGARHRVLLLVGDQLGDFHEPEVAPEAVTDSAARQRAVAAFAPWWGERWFMLPNPAYGDWERVLTVGCSAEQAASDRRACLHAHGLRMD